MAQIDVADENLVKLLQIQHVVNTEEELESSLDEVLTRVLDFYRMFVQARNRAHAIGKLTATLTAEFKNLLIS